jgi:diketogulonate reductase-like aldo/keto reductase
MLKFVEGDCLNHPLVKEMSQKYKKSCGQILLRHTIQKGVNVIPKSTNEKHLKENFNIYDFEISEEDQTRLDGIKERVRFLNLEL